MAREEHQFLLLVLVLALIITIITIAIVPAKPFYRLPDADVLYALTSESSRRRHTGTTGILARQSQEIATGTSAIAARHYHSWAYALPR